MSKDDTGLLKKRSEYSSRIKGALLLFSPASTRECARGHGEMSSSDSESTEKNASPVGHLADQAGGCCGLTLWSSWVPMITFFAEFSFSPLYLVPLLYDSTADVTNNNSNFPSIGYGRLTYGSISRLVGV
ncbi:hypothetical protein MPTK1_7g18650 [Marchantia polymorpha subsp. ruderalis]|uniref:Uncharacterized protein n=2 Tax=Marchantia polymorpha TaxID=3197 RepID=A0AAF6C162_MARPO|nr:hypothetical protein MARPO_0165s0025 [Marchantia polymorpha]BBN17996.1 hypothetical protein Mp_7g18650 [Marchantia polymorpha subsp. ruderalis]|eukprot:PTQ28398.1 hypothetical protein MARPO_0165s0025 [Marchantia polymorpha]